MKDKIQEIETRCEGLPDKAKCDVENALNFALYLINQAEAEQDNVLNAEFLEVSE